MTDIANIRRRRLERLANNAAPVSARSEGNQAGEDVPSKTKESGGMTEAQDSTVPSEFECILCLRCVWLRYFYWGTERGGRVSFTRKGCLPLFALCVLVS